MPALLRAILQLGSYGTSLMLMEPTITPLPVHAKHACIPSVHHSLTQPTGAFVHGVSWLWAKGLLPHNGLKALADISFGVYNTIAVAGPEASSKIALLLSSIYAPAVTLFSFLLNRMQHQPFSCLESISFSPLLTGDKYNLLTFSKTILKFIYWVRLNGAVFWHNLHAVCFIVRQCRQSVTEVHTSRYN